MDDIIKQQNTNFLTTTQTGQQPSENIEEKPAMPVSVPSKESGPGMPVSSEKLMHSSKVEMKLSPELKEAGVETSPERAQLTPEDANKEIVIEHAKESVPVVIPEEIVHFPMTRQQVQQQVNSKKKQTDLSIYWLALLIWKQFQLADKHKQDNKQIKEAA